MLRRFIINGANLLVKNKEKIDALNVFPVPDGDTGTNMSMTAMTAAEFVRDTNTPNIYEVAKAAASGALRGARGNSGVILSQIFRGIAKGLEGKSVADCKDIAFAFEKAKETAYKAVMKPKEGTILTIIRALADKSLELAQYTDDIEELISSMLIYSESVLDATCDMLPQLKQAGVIDAGGCGLLHLIRGGYEQIGIDNALYDTSNAKSTNNVSTKNNTDAAASSAALADDNIKFGYCTEFFVNLPDGADGDSIASELTDYLSTIGDSLVVVADESVVKIHVHTNNPGLVLERALRAGSIDRVKIENMRIQHTNLISFSQQTKPEHKSYGFVCVASGDGMSDVFTELDCDQIVSGGQTMNPSTEDILEAIGKVNAETVFVMPNNSNIILAAKQAAELCEDKKVHVIESKTVPQGIAAIIAFTPYLSTDKNIEAMTEALGTITTGQATKAVRSTTVDGKSITEGDYLFLLDGNINNTSSDLGEGLKVLVSDMLKTRADAGLISLYYGEDIDEEDAMVLAEALEAEHSEVEVDLRYGGQSVYYYIVSVE
jgi:DAK2 domain fusion protein YloV